jgi:phospholipase/carboxylesterase
MHKKNFITAGERLEETSKVLIMVHGRGGTADDILSLASDLNVKDFMLLAPQATNNSWYPYSFLAEPADNEPWLSSALSVLKAITEELNAKGINNRNIYFLGFSQGACLILEFVTRNANGFGGVAAFTGGLIGNKIYDENYSGNFSGTPVFIGSGDPDPHVPVERVNETALMLESMNAAVTKKIYKNMGHIISQDELDAVNEIIFPSNKF